MKCKYYSKIFGKGQFTKYMQYFYYKYISKTIFLGQLGQK